MKAKFLLSSICLLIGHLTYSQEVKEPVVVRQSPVVPNGYQSTRPTIVRGPVIVTPVIPSGSAASKPTIVRRPVVVTPVIHKATAIPKGEFYPSGLTVYSVSDGYAPRVESTNNYPQIISPQTPSLPPGTTIKSGNKGGAAKTSGSAY